MSNRWQALLILVWIILAAAPWFEGRSYYVLPYDQRPDSRLYEMYRPSGLLGHGLGIVGTLLVAVGVILYSARKRFVWMQGLGKLRDWLRFHIFVCTLGPYFVLLHTTFKIGNVAAVAFWTMSVVVASGVFGRYLYRHIPKTANGDFFTESDILTRTAALTQRVGALTGIQPTDVDQIMLDLRPEATTGLVRGIQKAIQFDLGQSRLVQKVEAMMVQAGVSAEAGAVAVPLLVDALRFEQRRTILEPMQRLFGYWHVLHIPLALVMLLSLLIHIGVAIAFGYHWIF